MKYIILFLLFLNISCGTETGNPATSSSSCGGIDPCEHSESQEETTIYQVISKSCTKLNACYGISISSCVTDIRDLDGFDTALGLDSADYDDARTIRDDESNGVIEVQDEEVVNQCYEDIEELECSDSEVINAYDSDRPEDYNEVYKIVPIRSGSCQDVYREN